MRFGVLIDEPRLDDFQRRCIAKLSTVSAAEFVVLIVADAEPDADTSSQQVHVVRVETENDGTARVLDGAGESLVADAKLDLLLVLTREVVRGRFIETLRYGGWVMRFGNTTRAADALFWLRYDGKLTLDARLERLCSNAHDAIALRSGTFGTRCFGAEQKIGVMASRWPAQVCIDLLGGVGTYVDGPAVPAAELEYRKINAGASLRVRLRDIAGRLAARLSDNPVRASAWHVGIVQSSPLQVAVATHLPSVEWLPLPSRPRSYLADPFPLERDGRRYVMCEEYDYLARRGVISFVALDEHGDWSAPKRVIERPHHMSYPFLIEDDGRVYCVPETYEARKVSLYVADSFPEIWHEEAVLLEDFAAVDSTIVRHGGRWWLFCTNYDEGDCTSLWIFHSLELRGPWLPHDNNPVKTDVTSARCAGPFFREGTVLYRPAQDCSDRYGARVMIHRVVTLSARAFREELVTVLEPDHAGPYPSGFHTIGGCNGWAVVDGNRSAYNRAAMRSDLRHYAAGISRTLARPLTRLGL
jgi:hypothetical protein